MSKLPLTTSNLDIQQPTSLMPVTSPNRIAHNDRHQYNLTSTIGSRELGNMSPANSNSDGEDASDDENDNDFNSPIQMFLKQSQNFQEQLDSKDPQATEEGPQDSKEAKQYSMEPDMIFGWKPKYVPQAPVPLRFYSPMVEEIVKTVHRANQGFPEVIYQGFRPDDTLAMHEMLSTNEAYNVKLSNFVQSKYNMFRKLFGKTEVNPKRPFVGMKQGIRDDCLVFDSIFEHGNLDTVVRKTTNEYDLFVRVDSNTKGHTNWYYFTVKNMKKGQRVKFNILNLSKKDSLYQRGKKPYIHSQKLFREKGVEWCQTGEHINFQASTISYLGENFEEPNHKQYYKVSFEYICQYDNDTVSFALCPPYTYTQLLQFIQSLIDNNKSVKGGSFITTSKLCTSLSGINVPLITVTDPDESEVSMSKRKYLVCTSRVHPGESNASWMIQGFLENLCKNTPEARLLRKHFIFKVIPMLNVDGVILGNHRTGMCGNDLNRSFVSPKSILHPSIVALKELVREIISNDKEVFTYMDFHGHSLKKNVFTYGAEFPVYDPNYYRVKILPKLLAKRTPMFRFQSCTFSISRPKLTTARAVFSLQYGITHFYTLEASYASYVDENRVLTAFTATAFMAMGSAVVESVYDYKRLLDETETMAIGLKIKRDDLIKLTLEKLEGAAPPVSVERTLAIEKPVKEKVKNTHILTLATEESSSFKPVSGLITSPKTSGNEGERKKGSSNKKFRIRKGKGLEVETNLVKELEPTLDISSKSTKNNLSTNVSASAGKDSGREKDKESKASGFARAGRLSFGNGMESIKEQHLGYSEDIIEAGMKLGLFSLMEEIKGDMANIKAEEKAESDSFSEGGSDSEGSEDDFGNEELKKLQKNIVNELGKFRDVCSNEDKYENLLLKKKDKKKKKKSNKDKNKTQTDEKAKKSAAKKLLEGTIKDMKKSTELTTSVTPSAQITNRYASRNVSTAADQRPVSYNTFSPKKGDSILKNFQVRSTKPPLMPKELQGDSSIIGNSGIKNQMNSFYMNNLSTKSKRNALSSQGMRRALENIGPDSVDKQNSQETVKVIHMNSMMDKRYRQLKPAVEVMFPSGEIKPVTATPGKGDEWLGLESFNGRRLDRGYRTSMGGFSKQQFPNLGEMVDDSDSKDEVLETQTYNTMKRQGSGFNLLEHRPNQEQNLDELERHGSRGKARLGGVISQVTVATTQIYTSYNKIDFPIHTMTPARKKKLPIAFETYKKMLTMKRKNDETRDRKNPVIGPLVNC